MNTNPSTRTEYDTTFAFVAQPTKQSIEQRTVNVVLASRYEVWQLANFLVPLCLDLQLTNASSKGIEMRLTLHPNQLGLPELSWLLENFFHVAAGADALQLTEGQARLAARPPNTDLLFSFAALVHEYLDMFDLAGIVKSLMPEPDRTHIDVVLRNVPAPERDLPGFEQHLRACMSCVRVAYVDYRFKR